MRDFQVEIAELKSVVGEMENWKASIAETI